MNLDQTCNPDDEKQPDGLYALQMMKKLLMEQQ